MLVKLNNKKKKNGIENPFVSLKATELSATAIDLFVKIIDNLRFCNIYN